jgi:hypothetical protein
MNKLLYILAVILLICWLIGVFILALGKLVHLLLILACIVVLIRLLRRRGNISE